MLTRGITPTYVNTETMSLARHDRPTRTQALLLWVAWKAKSFIPPSPPHFAWAPIQMLIGVSFFSHLLQRHSVIQFWGHARVIRRQVKVPTRNFYYLNVFFLLPGSTHALATVLDPTAKCIVIVLCMRCDSYSGGLQMSWPLRGP